MNAPVVALGNVVEIKGGGTPSKANSAFWGGDIPWVSPKDMKRWEITDAEDKITREAIEGSATNLIPENAILIVNRSGILKHTLPVGITRRPVAINQDIKALICGTRADAGYIAHIVKASEPVVLRWVRATTADNFSIDNLRNLEIPLPPLAEQRRIAAILDKADGLRRKRQRAIDLLDSLTQSIFQEMFGDRSRHTYAPITELADLQIGFAFKSSEYTDASDGVKLCRGTNVLPGKIDWSDLARWPKTRVSEFSSFELRVGDVVVAMDRPWISSGFKVAQLTESDVPSLLVQRVARLRAKQETDRAYLLAIVTSREFSQHLKPTETTVPHISPIEIRHYATPIASERERASFSAAISKVDGMRLGARKALAEALSLFSSLQHRAFSGQL
ncbi:restriction endonuclease subunit S [Mesorhizobium sp. ZC-5]|uniref:restriction endonuclease subunit S n=1 Tax=Mesorhizobium sp. ZC-5 TaxID=2986066 RepID=UPI0021E9AB0A|nr:restriction endonuclease subunit S [Mesorhizobium sp. ZC-5]MCV3243297.1 restriction endonuclease subunit S [Mesorhizobium sp. ZC-5]